MKDQRLIIPEFESIKKKAKRFEELNMALMADIMTLKRTVEPLYKFYKENAGNSNTPNPKLAHVIAFVLRRVKHKVFKGDKRPEAEKFYVKVGE